MYRFPAYWTEKMKIEFLQRVILIHSYLYYEKDNPVWSDRQFDEVSKQLAELQNEHDRNAIRYNTQYGYAFYDFDGSTGFHLWGRLKRKDKETVQRIADNRKGQNNEQKTNNRRTQKNVELDCRTI